jgi:RNA polymerase sigma factor (sigma-70 family)
LPVPTGPLNSFLRHFRRRLGVQEAGELTDADLLGRFARGRDEAAFAALLQRHGPLVLGVCRRALNDPNDADDAFQATFLVLARKAGSVGQPDRLASWLYGVALRVSRKARAEAARRRGRQQQVTDMPAAEPGREADREELRQLLDEEVQRLPEKFRLPLLLCYLQGKTREEAARQLGRSPGAVKGMLERGRELLRSRLARRGVTLSAASLAAVLSENTLSAAVPAALADATLKAALLFAAGQATAAGGAAALAEGVLRIMWMNKFKGALAVVLALGLVGAGTGLFALGSRSAEPQTPGQTEPAPGAGAKVDLPRRQAAARLDAAREAYHVAWTRFRFGWENEQTLTLWSRRWLQAQLDLADTKADREAALRAHRERLGKVDEAARARWDLGGSAGRLDTPVKERQHYEAVWERFRGREASPEEVCRASARLLMAQRSYRKSIESKKLSDVFLKDFDRRSKDELGFALRDKKSEFQAHLDRVRKIEEIARAKFEAGMYTALEQQTATFYRLEAEDWLRQGQAFKEDAPVPGIPAGR